MSSTTAATLILVQEYMTRYVLPTILAFGTLGNLLAVASFCQKNSRKSSCSVYLAAISVFGLVDAWWAIPPIVNALDHFDMVNSSLVLCRIRGYILQVCGLCFRYTTVLMCIDRYASCHPRATIRALCRPQIAYRSIAILIPFWMIVSVHLLIWESIENNRCYVYGLYGQIFGYYNLILSGIIPILCIVLISIPLMRNLRQIRSRIQPQGNNGHLNRRDVNLMKIILAEVVVYVVCSIENPLMIIYSTTTSNLGVVKSAERKQIESFMSFITMSLLLYLIYNIPFYVHFFASKTYRKEIKQFIVKLIPKYKIMKPNQGTVHTAGNITRTNLQMQKTSTV